MILWRKMVRDVKSGIGAYLACLVLVTLGMIAFLAFAIARDNMTLAKEEMYRRQRFADGFADLTAMPETRLRRIRRLPGINRATGRLVMDVQVYVPDAPASVYLRLVSLDPREVDRLNDVMLLAGEDIAAGELECWLDVQFFQENQLALGDTIDIIAGGRVREMTIRGMGINPEFVYPLRTEADIYNDPSRFGIAFVSLETMWRFFPDHDKALNSIVFTVAPGTDFETVRETLQVELDRYGVIEIYPRDDHGSHFILTQEIDAIETLATFFPVLILSVAGFIIYIVLKRLVEQQRGQIGILKAFGYSRLKIMLHYFYYSLFLAIAGGTIGGLIGMWLANPLTDLLYEFFHLPPVYAGFSLSRLALSVAICLGVLGFAGYQGCKRVLRLTPVQAMQPAAPPIGRHNLLERLPLFAEMLTVQGKMAVRNLSRSRSRTAFLLFGLAVSCAMVTFTWALAFDAMPKFMFYPYEEVQTHDARINLYEHRGRIGGVRELQRLPGVRRVEPIAEIPVRLNHRWYRETIVLMGLPTDAYLYNILDVHGRRLQPPDRGLILSQRLADKLAVSTGDVLELESIYLRSVEDSVEIEIVDIVPQYIGMNAYMSIAGLERLLRKTPFATAYLIEFTNSSESVPAQIAALRQRYRDSANIAGIDSRFEQVELMREYWEEANWIIVLYVMIGVVFSFAIIYISSLVVLSERQRELASMRVLGMSAGEVLSVVTFEQWFVTFFAILIGLPGGWAILQAFAREWSTDMYSMPAAMSTSTIVAGALVTIASVRGAQLFARRQIKQLNLVAVLKSRE